MIDEIVGDYTIISSLGKGGFGSVWKAKATDDTIVALKILNPQALENKKVVKKFFHEAMILAKLAHPNITKLIEFFPDGENYAIVMEYVEGVELKKILQQHNGPLPFDQAYHIARQSLDAFQYAHENGILHRDIKPGNIIINNNGDAKLMDFGIAKMSSTASHDTAASMLSINYVPPERFDKSKEVDTRSDIYSLGLVFYEMFAGRRPFDATETSEIMFCHINQIPEPPDKYAKSLPHNISEAISKSLEKDPDDRFNDFRQFSNALEIDNQTLDDVTSIVDLDATQIDETIDTGTIQLEPDKKTADTKKKKTINLIVPILAVFIIAGIIGYVAFIKKDGPEQIQESQQTITATAESGQKNAKGFNEIKHPKDDSVMIRIPEAKFTMGSDKYSAEKPVQQIQIDKYYIDKFLVSNKQFGKFVEETEYLTDAEKEGAGMVRIGRRWKKVEGANWQTPDGLTSVDGKDDYPVSQISYNDALKYCQWANKDLPTEAQWENTARGPNGNEFPWGDSEPNDTMANFDNIIGAPTPVSEYEKGQSYYGAYDMAGNVYQWSKDWYATGNRKDKNPAGPDNGKERVIKGGSFIEGIESLRSANRDRYEPDYSSFLFGFRCACEDVK